MSHESDTTALRGAAEEGHLRLVSTQLLSKREHGLPGCRRTDVLVVLDGVDWGSEASICLDNPTESYVKQRSQRGTKVPKVFKLKALKIVVYRWKQARPGNSNLHDTLSSHRVGLLVDTLGVPESLFLVLVVWTNDDRDNVGLEPEA